MGDAREKLTGGERLMLQLLHLLEKIRLGVMLASLCLLRIQSPLWVQLVTCICLSCKENVFSRGWEMCFLVSSLGR